VTAWNRRLIEIKLHLSNHTMSAQEEKEKLPPPPPSYPRSYRKPMTKDKYAGMICCTLCKTAVHPSKIDRHESGESKVHNANLAKRYAEEQRQIRVQQQTQHQTQQEKKRRERDWNRQMERQKDVDKLDRELEQQQEIVEEIEISSTKTSSSSSSSDDDSDVQSVSPPSKPSVAAAQDDPALPRKSSKQTKKAKGVYSHGPRKWQAQLSVAGKCRYIGCFRTREEATAACQFIRKALDASGLPPMDKDRQVVFDSAKARAKEVTKAVGASASTNMPVPSSSPAAPTAVGKDRAITSSISEGKGSGSFKSTPSGLKVLAVTEFTGAQGTTRCEKTTTRGKACRFCAVPDSRFCYLHGRNTSRNSDDCSVTAIKRKRGPVADGWMDEVDPGVLDGSSSIMHQKKPRSSFTTISRQQTADLEEKAAQNLGLVLPKKPKPPTGSFMFYQMEQAAEVAAFSISPNVSKTIGDMWRSLSAVKKSRYDVMAQNSRKEYEEAADRYKDEFVNFKKANPGWQREYDRILEERTAATLEADCDLAAGSTVPSPVHAVERTSQVCGTHPHSPPNPQLLASRQGYSQSPKITSSKLPDSDEMIVIGLKNGSFRLEPKNEIILENIELVMASRDDEERRKSNSVYRRGNVGLRCIHCKHLSRQEQKKQALVFPRDISCFGNNFSNFRHHFRLCQNIGSGLRAQLENPSNRRPPPEKYVSSLRYCIAAGKILGLENDPNGTVRFSIDVVRGEEPVSFLINPACNPQNATAPTHSINTVGSPSCPPQDDGDQTDGQPQTISLTCTHCNKSFSSSPGLKYHLGRAVCLKGNADAPPEASGKDALDRAICKADSSPSPLIRPNERTTDVTDFLYLVVNQFKLCSLTQAKKKEGHRAHLPLGLAGLECKYCSKTMFCSTPNVFVKVIERLNPHLQSCIFVPVEVKNAINSAKYIRKDQVSFRGLTGAQGIFSDRMYGRLVAFNRSDESAVHKSPSTGLRALPTHCLMKTDTTSKAPADNSRLPTGHPGVPSFDGGAGGAIETEFTKADARTESEFVFPCSQRRTTTDFNYLIIRQFSLCRRSSQEKRSRFPTGYPGICCIHCQTKMYFPDSNSFVKQFSQKVCAHLRSCPRAPPTLSVAITQTLQNREAQKQILGVHGSLTSFCDRVLGKMLSDAEMSPLSPVNTSTCTGSRRSRPRLPQSSHSCDGSNETPPFIDTPVLLEMDKPLATEHHFDLLSQFGIGELTEGARRRNPSLAHFPVGQPGLRCRHCKSKAFYYERMSNMKTRCISQVRDHIRTCTSVPAEVRSRFTGEFDHSTIQRQLGTLEGGSLDKLLHRLWLRLYHDFSRRKEIAAISQSTPLLDDYDSDESLFSSSSGNEGSYI